MMRVDVKIRLFFPHLDFCNRMNPSHLILDYYKSSRLLLSGFLPAQVSRPASSLDSISEFRQSATKPHCLVLIAHFFHLAISNIMIHCSVTFLLNFYTGIDKRFYCRSDLALFLLLSLKHFIALCRMLCRTFPSFTSKVKISKSCVWSNMGFSFGRR